jgi:phosphatidate cytidylyltransferase
VAGLTGLVIVCWRLRGPIEGYVADVTATLFLLIYPCLLIAALMFILALPHGSLKIAIYVLGITGVDTGGYVFGLLMGKHKFSPRISPKKSWEGVAGSFVLSGLVVVLLSVLTLHVEWWRALILAVVLVCTGIAGDLVESVIKRDLGIKDMGTVLPGHGGVMDRIDGYILAAVPCWLVMIALFP